ncbi:transcriptional regulator NrdR [Candidatus Nomurabacteria bacterium]|nr:transcriptional regulator NrdR [Candidatus Nomurabacteria bacterium]
MKCPLCLAEDTKVIDTRANADGLVIRRRRECPSCQERFSTNEQLELLDVSVLKRDGRRESYEKEKLIAGVTKSLEKIPHTGEQVASIINAIELDIHRMRKDVINSTEIGSIVMKHLKNYNNVAYIRFASVYGSWQDAEAFSKALKDLI